MNDSPANRIFRIFNNLFFIIVGITMLYPLWYVIMYSLSDPTVSHLNYLYLLPSKFTFDTYKYVLAQRMIYMGYKNTILVTIAGTVVNILVISFAAYSLSKERLIAKKYIFYYFLFTMLFDGGMIPTYLVVRELRMVDTLWALFIPKAMNVFYLLVMIRFFKSIPLSMIESAKIDGCNEIRTLFVIVLPLSTAVIAAIGLFCAVGYWNEYLSGIIYINSSSKSPLQVILYSMLRTTIVVEQYGYEDMAITPESVKMCVVVVALLPILAVYPFLQKYFVKGVMIGAVKG